MNIKCLFGHKWKAYKRWTSGKLVLIPYLKCTRCGRRTIQYVENFDLPEEVKNGTG
jgi:hypothetical protein